MRSLLSILFLAMASPVTAAECGGSWGAFLKGAGEEAISRGVPADAAQAVISAARQSNVGVLGDGDGLRRGHGGFPYGERIGDFGS